MQQIKSYNLTVIGQGTDNISIPQLKVCQPCGAVFVGPGDTCRQCDELGTPVKLIERRLTRFVMEFFLIFIHAPMAIVLRWYLYQTTQMPGWFYLLWAIETTLWFLMAFARLIPTLHQSKQPQSPAKDAKE